MVRESSQTASLRASLAEEAGEARRERDSLRQQLEVEQTALSAEKKRTAALQEQVISIFTFNTFRSKIQIWCHSIGLLFETTCFLTLGHITKVTRLIPGKILFEKATIHIILFLWCLSQVNELVDSSINLFCVTRWRTETGNWPTCWLGGQLDQQEKAGPAHPALHPHPHSPGYPCLVLSQSPSAGHSGG